MALDPVPVSHLIESAIDLSDGCPDDLREVCFMMDAACRAVGLPILVRWDEERGEEIPDELLLQIRGRYAAPLMEVEWCGSTMKIVAIDLPSEFDGIRGGVIPFDHTPRWLSLVDSEAILDDLHG